MFWYFSKILLVYMQSIWPDRSAVGAVSELYSGHKCGCAATAGTVGPSAAGEASLRERHMPREEGTLHTMFW